MEQKIRIIDKRVKEKFLIDDQYLNGQAKICGWQATLAYISLCRHCDKNQESFPSIQLMRKELKIGRNTIIKGLKNLEKFNVIKIEKTRAKNGKWVNNIYILIDKSEWNKDQVPVGDTDSRVPVGTQPCPCGDKNQVPVGDIKETHTEGNTYKETHPSLIEKGETPVSYGNGDINIIYDFLRERLGGSPDGSVKENRRFAYLLLGRLKKDYPDQNQIDLVKFLIEAGLKDSFHGKNLTNFKYLYYHAQQILSSIKSRVNNPKYIVI